MGFKTKCFIFIFFNGSLPPPGPNLLLITEANLTRATQTITDHR